MKTSSVTILILTFLINLSTPMYAHQMIHELSYFTVLGEWDLYLQPKANESAFCFRTLNHEGGVKLEVIENGKAENNGQWHRVLLINGQWKSNGEWVPSYSKFWIFIPNDADVFDYDEL